LPLVKSAPSCSNGARTAKTAVLAVAMEEGRLSQCSTMRRHALVQGLGIEVIGTLGVVLRAKKENVILSADVLPVVARLWPVVGRPVLRAALDGMVRHGRERRRIVGWLVNVELRQ